MSKRNKQKPKQRVKKRPSSESRQGLHPSQPADPTPFAVQAAALIDEGKGEEAIELLEPLLERYPRSPELLGIAAVAYSLVGDIWSAIDALEKSKKYISDSSLLGILASLYFQAGLNIYAMQTARAALKDLDTSEEKILLQDMLASIEPEFEKVVQSTSLSATQVEVGLRHHDDAQRANSQMDYQAAIDASRRAIRILGNWPPAHNNLSMAFFYNGNPTEAIATVNNVLDRDPDNVHALSNGIKFLAWSGKIAEAQVLWDRLRPLTPQTRPDRVKQAEAAAILEDDENVYQILKPLVDEGLNSDLELENMALYYFVVAEANTNRTKSAINHLKSLDPENPMIKRMAEGLKAKRPGIGWADRYPYFSIPELMPITSFDKFELFLADQEKLDERQYRKRADRLIAEHPQLLLIGKKLIWEEEEADMGISLLEILATPEAYALIREFGLSQLGSDEVRMDALMRLQEIGVIDRDETVTIWQQGAWSEVKLVAFEVSDEPDIVYPPAVVKLYEQALDAYHKEDLTKSEHLFKQILTLEPQAADAYFNLGTIYIMQDDEAKGNAMYQKAIELRPLYALPRCQLANYLLMEGDVQGAIEMLLPLTNATRLSKLEINMYMYMQARIHEAEEDYDKALSILNSLLQIAPDFEPAQELFQKVQLLNAVFMLSKAPTRNKGRKKKP